MPSGITAAIYEDKDVTLEQFLQRVARNFSLAIMQREGDRDAPVERDEGKSKFHEEQIAEAEAALLDLDGMSIEEAIERAMAEHDEKVKNWEAARANKVALRSRYQAMVRQVEAWEPEPLVAYLKQGALEQLRESLRADCGEPGGEMKYWKYPQLLAGQEWIEAKTTEARRDIEYSREEIAKRQKVAAERNEHIDAFYRSLGSDD